MDSAEVLAVIFHLLDEDCRAPLMCTCRRLRDFGDMVHAITWREHPQTGAPLFASVSKLRNLREITLVGEHRACVDLAALSSLSQLSSFKATCVTLENTASLARMEQLRAVDIQDCAAPEGARFLLCITPLARLNLNGIHKAIP